jgi:hypothetical protein
MMRSRFVAVFLFVLVISSATGRTIEGPVEFAGLVQKGPTYRAQITFDDEQGWHTVVKLRVPYHHAARIEWVNLDEYPALGTPERRSRRQRIQFEMVSREVAKVSGQDRWNTTYSCRIIGVE